jgi:hypothetical protein
MLRKTQKTDTDAWHTLVFANRLRCGNHERACVWFPKTTFLTISLHGCNTATKTPEMREAGAH